MRMPATICYTWGIQLLFLTEIPDIPDFSGTSLPVVHLKEEELKEEVHYKISERLIMIFQNFLSDEVKSSLSYSINELMDNVLFHAQSKHGLWLQLQKYQTLNLIELCIYDLGVGISESMKENPDFSSFDSYHRFLLALEIRNTSKPHSNSGEGLSSILEWISLNAEAEGVIFSKRESWIKLKNRNPVTAESEKVLWPGTLIWLAIPGDIEYNLLYTWKKLNLSPDC